VRSAFVQNLATRASIGEDMMLIVGDLGFGVVESFADKFPQLFLNAGVAEQNMTGMAAGIAAEGTRVFTYSIANFPTMRALEQIRNDVCYHSFPVTIVAVGSGVDYGTLGYSHFAVEDIAVMRPLPSLIVYSPADDVELFAVIDAIFLDSGPSYVRLSKDSKPDLPIVGPWSDTSSPRKVASGNSKLLLLATGAITRNVLEACNQLRADFPGGFDLFSVPQISPIMLGGIEWRRYNRILSVEEHVLKGGFGSAVLEYLSDQGILIPAERLGIEHADSLPIGSSDYLRKVAGLDSATIALRIRSALSVADLTRFADGD
jgi:transketolase